MTTSKTKNERNVENYRRLASEVAGQSRSRFSSFGRHLNHRLCLGKLVSTPRHWFAVGPAPIPAAYCRPRPARPARPAPRSAAFRPLHRALPPKRPASLYPPLPPPSSGLRQSTSAVLPRRPGPLALRPRLASSRRLPQRQPPAFLRKVMECGGKRSATPLSWWQTASNTAALGSQPPAPPAQVFTLTGVRPKAPSPLRPAGALQNAAAPPHPFEPPPPPMNSHPFSLTLSRWERTHRPPNPAIPAPEPERPPLTPSLSPPPRRGVGARRAGEGWRDDDRFMGRAQPRPPASAPRSAAFRPQKRTWSQWLQDALNLSTLLRRERRAPAAPSPHSSHSRIVGRVCPQRAVEACARPTGAVRTPPPHPDPLPSVGRGDRLGVGERSLELRERVRPGCHPPRAREREPDFLKPSPAV